MDEQRQDVSSDDHIVGGVRRLRTAAICHRNRRLVPPCGRALPDAFLLLACALEVREILTYRSLARVRSGVNQRGIPRYVTPEWRARDCRIGVTDGAARTAPTGRSASTGRSPHPSPFLEISIDSRPAHDHDESHDRHKEHNGADGHDSGVHGVSIGIIGVTRVRHAQSNRENRVGDQHNCEHPAHGEAKPGPRSANPTHLTNDAGLRPRNGTFSASSAGREREPPRPERAGEHASAPASRLYESCGPARARSRAATSPPPWRDAPKQRRQGQRSRPRHDDAPSSTRRKRRVCAPATSSVKRQRRGTLATCS